MPIFLFHNTAKLRLTLSISKHCLLIIYDFCKMYFTQMDGMVGKDLSHCDKQKQAPCKSFYVFGKLNTLAA